MAMSLPDGVNMSERQEYRWLIHNGAPSLRLKALESLFHKFDLNGSGELDYDEFKKILWWLEYSLTDGGVREIFDELDEDKSNCLDITEFVRFFDVLEKYRNMYESDIKERQISLVRLKICQLFFVAITMATGFFAYSWVAASATGGDTGTWLTMTLIGASMLIIGVFLLAAWPIIAMKIAARQHAKEAKAMAEMYKSQRMAEGGVVEDDEDFATKEKRLQRGSKNRVSPTKGGAGRGGVDLNQSMTESMYGQQSPKGSTYRMTRMNMMEQSIMSSSLGHTSRFSPTGGGGGAGHSPMSGAQYQLQDLSGRQMRPDMTDEELIAEQQALEEHEDFAYHQGNYDLAKIQQGNLQPSTFHPMGTTRYKGSWVQKNNPALTIQGTSSYVGRSIENTTRMTDHAQREGLNREKIENIKLNSSISAGWYGGSCSPYETGGPAPQALNNRLSPQHGGVLGNKMLVDSPHNYSGKKQVHLALTQ